MDARRGARWLAAVPVLALVTAPFVANRVTPYVFGLPFLLAWIVAWVVLTSAAMGALYYVEHRGH
jgi:hypothetical protein